jgi:hypothetical protein
LLVRDGADQGLVGAALALHLKQRRTDAADQRGEAFIAAEVPHGVACSRALPSRRRGSGRTGACDLYHFHPVPLWARCAAVQQEGRLYTHRPLLEESARDQVAARQTAGLVGIVITLVLLIIGLFLVQQLRAASALEDCLMAGRHDCEVPATTAH